jgi:short-subunit dehydrogenase
MGFHYGHQFERFDRLNSSAAVNLLDAGVMHSMRAELKYLSEKGAIVNAASICGLVGIRGASAYCASKQFVNIFSLLLPSSVSPTFRV